MLLFVVPFAFLAIGQAAINIYKFRKAWGLYDPKQPHWYLDPLCVLPSLQGQGIGSALLKSRRPDLCSEYPVGTCGGLLVRKPPGR